MINENLSPEELVARMETLPDEEIPGTAYFSQFLSASKAELIGPILPELIDFLRQKKGLQFALNTLMRLEVVLGFRKPRLGIYDNAFHFIGGAQKYGCTVAAALQDKFDITLIANAEISLSQLQEWYDLDLSLCKVKVVPIPFFTERIKGAGVFDAGLVDLKGDNPFHVISRESGGYDFFINNCMLEMVYPLANISELICHFPEREISRFFHIGKYSHIIFNSLYTAEWIKRRWALEPDVHIYPPVDMGSTENPTTKEPEILSVSRFELSGNKQQLEMIKAFLKLRRQNPRDMQNWRLILAGGSTENNPYLARIRNLLESVTDGSIELHVNISAEELRNLYRRAKIFWHFSGLDQIDPARIEHFGMTTAEALQNGCAAVVFNGGGQKEIVVEGESGMLFKDQQELFLKTLKLIREPELLKRLGDGAFQKGQQFTKEVFDAKVKAHFFALLAEYKLTTDKKALVESEGIETVPLY